MNSCVECGAETSNPRFCSLSCSGKHQRGRRSNLINRDKTCIECGLLFKYIASPKQKFCSRSCAASYNNKKKERLRKICLNCPEPINSFAAKYCSQQCQVDFQKSQKILAWLDNPSSASVVSGISTTVRKFLINEAGNKCSLCGWAKVNPVTNKVPLEIDHVDGNSNNNSRENLRVLCPNCHSLTPTYRALNKKSSRMYR